MAQEHDIACHISFTSLVLTHCMRFPSPASFFLNCWFGLVIIQHGRSNFVSLATQTIETCGAFGKAGSPKINRRRTHGIGSNAKQRSANDVSDGIVSMRVGPRLLAERQ